MNSMVRHKSAGDITVNCINPGPVHTDVMRDPDGCFKCMSCLMFNCCCCCGKVIEHMSHVMRKLTMWLSKRSDKNRAVQAKKMARGWIVWI